MLLSALPIEIVSRICRFMGLEIVWMAPSEPLVIYKNRDFQSLRITCKELYQKTTYDAAVRYSILLEELEVNLEHSFLVQFLHIIKNPAFRDRIYTIYLYTTEPLECDDDDDDDDSSVKVPSAESIAFEKTAEEFRASSEAIHHLAKCFQNLEGARNLQRIELCSDRGHDMVLRAMSLASFSRRLAHFSVEPHKFFKVGYGKLSENLQACAPYIKGLQIQPNLPEEHSSYTRSPEQREENPLGLHLQNYRPTTIQSTKFVSALINMDSLELHGCRPHPQLRLCHGCDDLFAKNFARTNFPHLSSFTLSSSFISGGRLRRFIKCHATTLTNVNLSYVSLTDGSWRSIAQGLAKLPHLQTLQLEALRQKGRAAKITRPPQYSNYSVVAIEDASHIQHFLDVFVTFFSTVQCLNTHRFRRYPPVYHEARLFQLPELIGVSGRSGSLRAASVLRTYAEMNDIC